MAAERGLNNAAFGQRLRRARALKDLSQQQVADLTGIHANQLGRYEKGLSQPRTEILHKLAEVLEVSADYLMDGETSNAARANFEDQELLRLFQKAAALSPEGKETLKKWVTMLFALEKIDEIKAS